MISIEQNFLTLRKHVVNKIVRAFQTKCIIQE